MRLEEEHQALHRRGEVIKFLSLVVVLIVTVLLVAAARPLIFDRIVPAVMGWDGGGEPPAELEMPDASSMTATPSPTATSPPTVSPPTATPTPTPTPTIHQVQAGDTLSRIANRYGVSVEALIDANNLSNPDRLVPGDRLIIP